MANGVIRQDQNKQKLAQYLHASRFSPAIYAMLRAIKQNNLTTFPGLISQLISKHLSKNVATSKGHLDQEFRYLRSTKSSIVDPMKSPPDMNIASSQEENNSVTNNILCSIFDTQELVSKAYYNQTGNFPVRSISDRQYIFFYCITMIPIVYMPSLSSPDTHPT